MTVAATSGSAFTTTVSGTPSGVRAYTLGEGLLPLVVEPVQDGIVLADWNAANREWVEAQLLVHGAVLFRNFNLPSPADFERAAKAVYGELFATTATCRATPRERRSTSPRRIRRTR